MNGLSDRQTTLLQSWVLEIQTFTLLGVRSVVSFFRKPLYLREIFQQMDIVGVGSLSIASLTAFFTGAVLALQTSNTLSSFGAVGYTGQLVSVSLVRELGPVLTAVVVAGRVGSGIASELGSMLIGEQINAMRGPGDRPDQEAGDPARGRLHDHGSRSDRDCRHGWRSGWIFRGHHLPGNQPFPLSDFRLRPVVLFRSGYRGWPNPPFSVFSSPSWVATADWAPTGAPKGWGDRPLKPWSAR